MANRVRGILSRLDIRLDERWGLNHGTWSVLCHVFHETDVPVIQLNIDETQPPDFHYDKGKRLAPSRDEGF